MREMKEADYAEGNGDAGTKLNVHCLLYAALMHPTFSLAAESSTA